MLRKIRWATFTLWALGASSVLAAEPPKASTAPSPPVAAVPPPRAAVPAPELSPAQQKQVAELRAKTESQLTPLREQLAAKQRELQALWTADSPNRKEILKKDSEAAVLRDKIRQLLIEQRLSYLALLTAEQRTAWKTQRGMMGMGHGGMGHGGMGHGGMGHGGMGMGNMQGGMGQPQGGPGMGGTGAGECMSPGPCMELDGCMDCMERGSNGSCMSGAEPGSAPARPATPPSAPAKPAPPPR